MKLKLAVVAAAASLLTAAFAFGATHVKSKTSLDLGPRPGTFVGVVTADDPKCVAGRKVFVVRVEPEPKEKVARDFSDINGIWKRQTDELSGTWYAHVKPERRGGLYCKGDKSPERSAG
jgi:hypothetical protein